MDFGPEGGLDSARIFGARKGMKKIRGDFKTEFVIKFVKVSGQIQDQIRAKKSEITELAP